MSLSNILVSILAKTINYWLSRHEFPTSHQHAVVKPIFKKPSVDPAQLANYWPVSNLSFVWKLLECCVATQTSKCSNDNKMLPPISIQTSAFNWNHSVLAAKQGMATIPTVAHSIALEVPNNKLSAVSPLLHEMRHASPYINIQYYLMARRWQQRDFICSLPQDYMLVLLQYIRCVCTELIFDAVPMQFGFQLFWLWAFNHLIYSSK